MAPDCIAAEKKLVDGLGLVVRFWCKDVPCGDIYLEANQISDSGAVLGWTNDSGYGQKGDVVYLALQAINGPVFAYPAITKAVVGRHNVIGFPIGVGRP